MSITGALALAPKVGTFNFYVLLVSTVLVSGKNNCMRYRGIRLFSIQVASCCSLISYQMRLCHRYFLVCIQELLNIKYS